MLYLVAIPENSDYYSRPNLYLSRQGKAGKLGVEVFKFSYLRLLRGKNLANMWESLKLFSIVLVHMSNQGIETWN